MSLYDYIKRKEGFRSNVYDDVGGVPTIGYGRTGGSLEPTTREAEDAWLQKRVDSDRAYVQDYANKYGYNWSPEQTDALTSFVYNLGRGGLDQLTKKGTRDDSMIGSKILEYNKAGGQQQPGLVTRRQEESAMFTGAPARVPHRQEVPKPQPEGSSFGEAFAAARKEQGAGGEFEWGGNFYTTDYKEEDMQGLYMGTPMVQGYRRGSTKILTEEERIRREEARAAGANNTSKGRNEPRVPPVYQDLAPPALQEPVNADSIPFATQEEPVLQTEQQRGLVPQPDQSAVPAFDYSSPPRDSTEGGLDVSNEIRLATENVGERQRIENEIRRLTEGATTEDEFIRIDALKSKLGELGGPVEENPTTPELTQSVVEQNTIIRQEEIEGLTKGAENRLQNLEAEKAQLENLKNTVTDPSVLANVENRLQGVDEQITSTQSDIEGIIDTASATPPAIESPLPTPEVEPLPDARDEAKQPIVEDTGDGITVKYPNDVHADDAQFTPDGGANVNDGEGNSQWFPPETVEKVGGLIKDFFGLEGAEIKRAIGMYLLSRATGASHAGSMQWAGQQAYAQASAREEREFADEDNQDKIDALTAVGYTPEQAKAAVVAGWKPTAGGQEGTKLSGKAYIRGYGQVSLTTRDGQEYVKLDGTEVPVNDPRISGLVESWDENVHSDKALRTQFSDTADAAWSQANQGAGEGEYVSDKKPGEWASQFKRISRANGISVADADLTYNAVVDAQKRYAQDYVAWKSGKTDVKPNSPEAYVNNQFFTALTGIPQGVVAGTVPKNFNAVDSKIRKDMDITDKNDPGYIEEYDNEWNAAFAAWSNPQVDKNEWIKRADKLEGWSPFMLFVDKTDPDRIATLANAS